MPQSRPFSHFVLPQELINAIVDELGAEGDTRSLTSVGLVNRAWCPRTRDHLFRNLNIPSFNYYDKGERMRLRCQSLSTVLKRRPRLLQCVKAASLIRIHAALFTLCPWFEDWIIGILNDLTFLAHFTLSGLGGNSSIYWLQWGEVPRKLQETLYGIMSRPQLLGLCLEGISNFDVDRLVACQNLHELSLRNIQGPVIETSTVSDRQSLLPSPNPPARAASHRSLGSLHVTACGTALTILLGTRRQHLVFHPETLSVDTLLWNKAMADACAVLIQKGGDTVRKYCIRHDRLAPPSNGQPNSPFPSPIFDFMHLPKLESLTISISPMTLIQEVPNPLSHLATALGELSARDNPSELAELEIELDFGPVYHDQQSRYLGADPFIRDVAVRTHLILCGEEIAWAHLDEVLARPTFAKLRRMSVVVLATRCLLPGDAWLSMRQNLLARMEELHGRRGIVHCLKVCLSANKFI